MTQIGALDTWRDFYGGFKPETSRDGRRVVDFELRMQFMGIRRTPTSPEKRPAAGSVVRVGQGVWRTWRATPDGPGVKWICIRAGGYELPEFPDDSERAEGRPSPW